MPPHWPTCTLYLDVTGGARPNIHAQCAVPSYNALLALDREEAVVVRCASDANANEEPLFVVSESLAQYMRTFYCCQCLPEGLFYARPEE